MSIHPTAIIDPAAEVAEGCTIGAYAIVEAGVKLGPGCVLAAHAIVRTGSILEENVRVDSFAVIGGDPQDLSFDPVTSSGVRIGAGTVLREGVTVHRSTEEGGFTTVGPGGLLMGNSHVGHDARVGARVVLANGTLLAGRTLVGDHVFFGGNSGLHQHNRVGESAIIAGTFAPTADVPPYTLFSGRNEVHGLNLVGLKRRGFGTEVIGDIKRCYRAVYETRSVKKNAEAALEAGLACTPQGKHFLEFFLTGKRSFCLRGRDSF